MVNACRMDAIPFTTMKKLRIATGIMIIGLVNCACQHRKDQQDAKSFHVDTVLESQSASTPESPAAVIDDSAVFNATDSTSKVTPDTIKVAAGKKTSKSKIQKNKPVAKRKGNSPKGFTSIRAERRKSK